MVTAVAKPYGGIEEVEHVAHHMRLEDALEVSSVLPLSMDLAVERTLERSSLAWTIWKDADPIGIFGVCEVVTKPDTGIPWLIGTPEIETISKTFLRESPEYIQEMHRYYRVLQNYVYKYNKTSIRWLSWLGFKFFPETPYGRYKLPFYPFMRIQ